MPHRALIVIDVQNDYDGGKLPIEFPPVAGSLAQIGRAIDAARAHGVPVIVVRQASPATAPIFAAGTPGGALHAVVASRGCEHCIEKKLPSSFAGTGLGEWLAAHAIDTLAVAGYMTHNCVLTTALDAFNAGLAVELLRDATGSVPYANRAGAATAEELHRVTTVVLESRFALVLTTDEWTAALDGAELPARDNIYASNQRARRARGVE
jgi:nicotinamidase-related amidase